MLLGFRPRFAPFVEDGSKQHTIRAKRKAPPKVGEICHCYVDPRQKSMRLLGRWPCVKVEDIRIYERGDGTFGVAIDGVELSPDEKDALAWRDGFRFSLSGSQVRKRRLYFMCFKLMIQYWLSGRSARKPKRPLDFHGDVIHWNCHAKPTKSMGQRRASAPDRSTKRKKN